MGDFKLTKNELRAQQGRLNQLRRYLPTLQLKKAMLQSEVNEVRTEIQKLEEDFDKKRLESLMSAGLYSQYSGFSIEEAVKVDRIEKRYENIAGVDVPVFEEVLFMPFGHALFGVPAWLDLAIEQLRALVCARARILVAEDKRGALEKELREVSIRVNLFEKSLIPKAEVVIRKIRIFLGDQELAAVGQAKMSKKKILMRKRDEG